MKSNKIKIFVLLLLFLAGCERENSADNQFVPLDTISLPDSEITGATIRFFNGSILSTEIQANMIRKYTMIDSMMAYVVDVNIFDSAGNITSNIVGDSGVIREQKTAY